MELSPGLTGSASLTVGDPDLSIAFGSGDVPVVATPRLVALCEEATMAALAGRLDAPNISVGTRVELDHIAPVGLGGEVEATATLVQVGGRSLRFAVEVRSSQGVVAAGTVRRVIVDRSRFLGTLDR